MANKRRRMFGFDDDFFDEFDRIHEMMEEMFREGLPSLPSKPLVYGFSMRVGPDGKPQFEQFGNVRQGRVAKEREPLVDVVDLDKEIRVVAELPGVDKENIRLRTERDVLFIEVRDPDRPYSKQLKLPAEVFEEKANASYKNGILEIVLEKKRQSPKPTIRVE